MRITEFLLERLDEDETKARSADAVPAPWGMWDDGRVLAECEAKRRIVDDATNQHTSSADYTQAVRYLAAVYADHPDYDQTWRPA